MTTKTIDGEQIAPPVVRVSRPISRSESFWRGSAFVWLSGGATAFALLLIVSVLTIIASQGLGVFWPGPIDRFYLKDGTTLVGEVWGREPVPVNQASHHGEDRLRVRAANRDLNGSREFVWVDESAIERQDRPRDVVLMERAEYGAFIGDVSRFEKEGTVLAEGAAAVDMLRDRLGTATELRDRIGRIERVEIGKINQETEKRRLRLRSLEQAIASGTQSADPNTAGEVEALRSEMQELEARYETLAAQVTTLRDELGKEQVLLTASDGRTVTLPLGAVYRVVQPNAIGFFEKIGVYFSRLWAFVTEAPRDANLEGGILPAIFGTVMMTFLMTVFVVPLGVITGLYLREYAKQGRLVRAVRIAVNNLAGVPSIVFGIFGLGFFVYMVGGSLDNAFFSDALPTPTLKTGGILWSSLTLALLTVPVVIVATEEGLAAVPRAVREGSLALGATKWETTWRVVLPAASPGILTGVILAISRAAGEVAPLMLTGAVKTATLLPVDGEAPFLHLERKFMHLGFHVYDLGFQAPNVEAAKPMVYMTTLLLVAVVVLLNLTAMWVRNRLWSRYRSASF